MEMHRQHHIEQGSTRDGTAIQAQTDPQPQPSQPSQPSQSKPTRRGKTADTPTTKDSYTIAACKRCRGRKTKCDPGLPRCKLCEKANSSCVIVCGSTEIDRQYIKDLQFKESDLRRTYADLDRASASVVHKEEASTEDVIRRGGLVSQAAEDETPRFLGPSSGVAMARLVIEEARKYTNSNSIREVVPNRQSPSVQGSQQGTPPSTKVWPMMSDVAAAKLPNHSAKQTLLKIFNEKAQYMFPTIHEGLLRQLVDDVYDNDPDPYKNYIVRMVFAISIQKMEVTYAALADSYYLNALAYIDDVLQPMNIYTIQCLILIAQYSLLTPTRSPVYHIIGLATRICLQLGLTSETSIMASIHASNALEQDMRRRMVWCVFNMELALAHSLGRPSGFAIYENNFDVKFFSLMDDEDITPHGIMSDRPCEKKIMCFHFFQMRLLQAEIRRTLYQTKREEPRNDDHEWHKSMRAKIDIWYKNTPEKPNWSKSWFRTKYNTFLVFLYRPSPQIAEPTARAAELCFCACADNIVTQKVQMTNPSFDKTWVFLQSIYMAVNTMLWSTSYSTVRAQHPKEEVIRHINTAIDIITSCAQRWPGAASAADLYGKLAGAVLQSYTARPNHVTHPPSEHFESSSPVPDDTSSPMAGVEAEATLPGLSSPMSPKTLPKIPQSSTNLNFNDMGFDLFTRVGYQSQLSQFSPPVFRSGSIFNTSASTQNGHNQFGTSSSWHNSNNNTLVEQPMPLHYPSNGSMNYNVSEYIHQPIQANTSLASYTNRLLNEHAAQFSVPNQLSFPDVLHLMPESSLQWPRYMGNQSIYPNQRLLNNTEYQELYDSLHSDGMAGIEAHFGMSPAQSNTQT